MSYQKGGSRGLRSLSLSFDACRRFSWWGGAPACSPCLSWSFSTSSFSISASVVSFLPTSNPKRRGVSQSQSIMQGRSTISVERVQRLWHVCKNLPDGLGVTPTSCPPESCPSCIAGPFLRSHCRTSSQTCKFRHSLQIALSKGCVLDQKLVLQTALNIISLSFAAMSSVAKELNLGDAPQIRQYQHCTFSGMPSSNTLLCDITNTWTVMLD